MAYSRIITILYYYWKTSWFSFYVPWTMCHSFSFYWNQYTTKTLHNVLSISLACTLLPTEKHEHPIVLFFSHPRSEGWPHHRRTFSIYLYSLSFWLTLSRGVVSRYWCCPSRPCVVFLACMHLALFLALSLSPGNSFVSSWCDLSMLASLLWQFLTVPSLLELC